MKDKNMTIPNTMITTATKCENFSLSKRILSELYKNGCSVPAIKRVIYNRGMKKTENSERPILATIIYFDDGTKVSVVNSEHDGLELGVDGKPTIESKERGLIYAIMKRIYASQYIETNDGTLSLETQGLGPMLTKLVNNAFDQQDEAAKRAAEKIEAKQKYDEEAAKPKTKNPSLAKCVIDLSQAIKDMNEVITTLKADINSTKA